MIQRILDKIESKRGSEKIIEKFFLWIKDRLYVLYSKYSFLEIEKEIISICGAEYVCTVKESKGILHIGAHVGQEAKLYHLYNKPVVWVEANPELFFVLSKKIKKYKKQIVIHALITDQDNANYDFKISNNDESSSIFDFGSYHQGKKNLWKGDFKMLKSISLKSETIQSIYEKHNLKDWNLDMLVLDIQGAELLALKGAGDLLDNFKHIWIEVSTVKIYKGGVVWSEIKNFLNERGFFENKIPVNCEDILFTKFNEFNDDVILSDKIKNFIKENNILHIVETGTYHADTTKYFESLVKNVYTIESNPEFYTIAKSRIDMPSNIKFYLGNSWELLDKEIISLTRDANTLYFLDAHWGNPCPTPLELEVIAKHNIKPYILIHDFKVPEHPELGWDIYPDFEYTFEHIKEYLDNIYGIDGYTYEYNTKAVGARRGIVLISPK